MGDKPGKNSDFIIYMICSAAVVAAATFYFHVSDMKENTTTIVIDKSISSEAEVSEPATELRTANPVPAVTSSATATTAISTESLYLDINSASHDELVKLNGIGDVLADAIIRYRQEYGGFRNIEEIMEVSGIGEKIFSDIRDQIYVIDPVYNTEAPTAEYIYEVDSQTEYQPTLEELAPININTADISELILLPHVDEETARQIIKLREDINGFGNTYELAYVENLSRSEVNDILPYVTVE